MKPINEDDVGTYWLGPEGDVWQLITYTRHPTVSWRKVRDPATRAGGVVGSALADEFKRLVPEQEENQT